MRLLVLTHTFPPSRHANAKRPFYLVRAFFEAGWQVDVLSLPPEPGARAGETLTHPALRVLRFGDPLQNLLARTSRRPALHKALALAIGGAFWPDEFAWWARRAFRFARSAAVPYDRVLAFIIPPSLLLGSQPNWIFDYQESLSPHQRTHPRRTPLQPVFFPLLARLERRAMHRAARVVFTAESNRQAYIQGGFVPADRTAHIPYFFDAEVFRAPATTMPPHFQVTYFGTFDWRGARSPETFLRALARFLERQPQARPQTRFLFRGSWLAAHDRLIDELKLRDVAAIEPAVSYAQYLEQVKQSPVLLLVVSSIHNLFMPSKIVDYFGAARPILAFVPRDSEMRRVLEAAGMAEFACDEFDVEAGVAALEKLWARHQAHTLTVNTDKTRFWSSETQVPRYLDLVRGI